MQATFTNLGKTQVPIGSTDGRGWVAPLEPGVPYVVSGETVVSVGDNPSFVEEITEAFDTLVDLFKSILTFWREHTAPKSASLDEGEVRELVVVVRIDNAGPNPLRVILGNNLDDRELAPHTADHFSATGYIEVRELGV